MTPERIDELRIKYAFPKIAKPDVDECLNEIEALRAECDALKARIAEVTCPECGVFLGMTDHHMDCKTGAEIDRKMMPEARWLWKNKAALQALVEGRAAVVPLRLSDNKTYIPVGYDRYFGRDDLELHESLQLVRLDKPVEDK